MSRMTRVEEADLVARVEHDADDADAWEDVSEPRSARPRPRRLGAQVTVRLSPETAEALSRLAAERGEGYTQTARWLIEDGLRTPVGTTPDAAGVGGDAAVARFVVEVAVRPVAGPAA